MFFVRKRKFKIPGILALIAALVLIATELQAGGLGNRQGAPVMNGTDLTVPVHVEMIFIEGSRAVATQTVELPN